MIDWFFDGGFLVFDLYYEWIYIFVNFGFGENVVNFNYSLIDLFFNLIGNGILCIFKVIFLVNLLI